MSPRAQPAAAPVAAPAAGSVRPAAWVRGPAWDLLWLHAALWLAPLLVLLQVGYPSAWDSPVHTLYVLLGATLWIAHRFSSAWVAYACRAYRPLVRAQPMRFVLGPALTALAVFGLVFDPLGVLPGTPLLRAAGLGAVDYLFGSYHFAAQHFGVLSLYRSRAGRVGDPSLRRLDRAYALGAGGALVVVAELTRGVAGLPPDLLPAVGPVAALEAFAAPAAGLGGLLVVGGAAALLWRELRAPRPSPPRALYVLGLAGTLLSAFVLDPFVFLVLWTVQHWTVAVGLASVVAGRGAARSAPRPRRARPLLLLVLGAMLLTPLFEVEASASPADWPMVRGLGPEVQLWLTSPEVLPWVLSLGLATAFVHYLLDRAVWRFSDPAVRAAAAPLLRPGPLS